MLIKVPNSTQIILEEQQNNLPSLSSSLISASASASAPIMKSMTKKESIFCRNVFTVVFLLFVTLAVSVETTRYINKNDSMNSINMNVVITSSSSNNVDNDGWSPLQLWLSLDNIHQDDNDNDNDNDASSIVIERVQDVLNSASSERWSFGGHDDDDNKWLVFELLHQQHKNENEDLVIPSSNRDRMLRGGGGGYFGRGVGTNNRAHASLEVNNIASKMLYSPLTHLEKNIMDNKNSNGKEVKDLDLAPITTNNRFPVGQWVRQRLGAVTKPSTSSSSSSPKEDAKRYRRHLRRTIKDNNTDNNDDDADHYLLSMLEDSICDEISKALFPSSNGDSENPLRRRCRIQKQKTMTNVLEDSVCDEIMKVLFPKRDWPDYEATKEQICHHHHHRLPRPPTTPPIVVNNVGTDRDKHGCIPSAGYYWCESQKKCIQSWESSCSNNVHEDHDGNNKDDDGTTTIAIGYHQDEHGCLLSAGFSWCNSSKLCYRPWETTCVYSISNGNGNGNSDDNSSLSSSNAQQQVVVGDSQDEHGCLLSAGYFWCEATNECLREWENPCPTTTTTIITAVAAATIVSAITENIDTILGDSRDEYGCLLSAGYSWCESSKSCLREEWKTPCPTITTITTPATSITTTTATATVTNENTGMILGGSHDEHGCLLSAGYSWCKSTKECLRAWETPCDDSDGDDDSFSPSSSSSTLNEVALVGDKRDEHGCNLSAGYSWCNSSKSCHRPWETPSCHDDHDNNNNNNIDNNNVANNIVVA